MIANIYFTKDGKTYVSRWKAPTKEELTITVNDYIKVAEQNGFIHKETTYGLEK